MQAPRNSIRRIWLSVALVTIGALIAIPGLKLARMTANEASAKRSLHAVDSAEAKFRASHNAKAYACTLGALRETGLIPESLASGEDRGYVFEIFDCDPESPSGAYRTFAHPATKNQTGYWVFCSDQTTRVKASPESEADCFEQGVPQS